MKKQANTQAFLPPLSRWRCGFVLFCALLFTAFSTAQAAHIHRTALGQHRVQVHATGVTSQAADEQICPLCAAAQSALPAVQPTFLVLMAVTAQGFNPAPIRRLKRCWHFAQLSRPPPLVFETV